MKIIDSIRDSIGFEPLRATSLEKGEEKLITCGVYLHISIPQKILMCDSNHQIELAQIKIQRKILDLAEEIKEAQVTRLPSNGF